MKATKKTSPGKRGVPSSHASKCSLAAVVAILIATGCGMAIVRAQQPNNDAPGAQVLTRGPVHEAFAGVVTFNPEPGIVVTKSPPEVIEEVPPDEKPEGERVTWIPGYWAWDDERQDFLWISGTWRSLPPGREWMPGYWGKTAQGYQWISGYWADATVRETTYLPPPPATVEAGPNLPPPSIDYGWTPGYWFWYQGRYAWRPGYWAQGRADWDWIPAHYTWTPRGHIFVGGFWDYPVARRGLLFAPIYFDSVVYSRRGYHYSPTIVIDLGVFTDHLFLRPSYHHYYFGDYYAASYSVGGFYTSFSFQSRRFGYDSIYSHQRWEHRQDREWEHRVATSYQYRRDHENARPPRTWVAQRSIGPGRAESKWNGAPVATSIHQLTVRKESPMRFQPVAREERQRLAQRGQEVQKYSDQRRTLEAGSVDTTARKPGGSFEPAKVSPPRSPIAAKPSNRSGRNEAPPPPKAQRAPEPAQKLQRNPELERKPGPARIEPAPREAKPQSEPQRRPNESGSRARQELQRAPRELEQPPKGRPAAGEKGATRFSNGERQREGKRKPSTPENPPGQ